MKAGCRFVPGSAGRLNYKAKGQTSKYLLYFFKDKSFLLLVWRASVKVASTRVQIFLGSWYSPLHPLLTNILVIT